MKLLLDTHIIIWALRDEGEVPDDARVLIADANNEIFFSMASVWEIVIKHGIRPDEIPYTGKEFYNLCIKSGFKPINGTMEHVLTIDTLIHEPDSAPHKDPFDRLLIAQAKSEGMLLVTHDDKIAKYTEECIKKV